MVSEGDPSLYVHEFGKDDPTRSKVPRVKYSHICLRVSPHTRPSTNMSHRRTCGPFTRGNRVSKLRVSPERRPHTHPDRERQKRENRERRKREDGIGLPDLCREMRESKGQGGSRTPLLLEVGTWTDLTVVIWKQHSALHPPY